MRPAQSLWKLLHRPAARKTRLDFRRRLEVEALEDRAVPTTSTVGTITAMAYVDTQHLGHFAAGDPVLPGLPVTLSGPVNLTLTSGTDGSVTFDQLPAGTYQVSFNAKGYSGTSQVSAIGLTEGQNANVSVGLGGLLPQFINQSQFLNSTTPSAFRFLGPTVANGIADQTVLSGSSNSPIDLSAIFSSDAITTSLVRMDTIDGPLYLKLFDSQTPQTVANFFNYVDSGAYTNSFFQRNGTNDTTTGLGELPILQGGEDTVDASSLTSDITTFSTIPTDGLTVADEFGIPNTQYTVAMANSGTANTASDQFFFNLQNNTSTLHSSGTNSYTVFAKLLDTGSQSNLTALGNIPTFDVNTTFPTIPVSASGYTVPDANFPTDLTPSDLALIKDVAVVNHNDALTYSIVSNSNPGSVIATISNERLTLTGVTTGTATITVQATDLFGNSVQTSFNVTAQ